MHTAFRTLALLGLLSVPVAAFADTATFTISIDGGTAVTYVIPDTPDYSVDGQYTLYGQIPNLGATLYLYNQNNPNYSMTSDGPLNVEIFSGPFSDLIFSGLQVYSGTEAHPVFAPSTFILGPGSDFGSYDTAVLMINGGAPISATPEPSAIVLLGTGVLGAFGMARRRFQV